MNILVVIIEQIGVAVEVTMELIYHVLEKELVYILLLMGL